MPNTEQYQRLNLLDATCWIFLPSVQLSDDNPGAEAERVFWFVYKPFRNDDQLVLEKAVAKQAFLSLFPVSVDRLLAKDSVTRE